MFHGYMGYDATSAFQSVGHSRAALRILDKRLIGVLPPAQRLGYLTDEQLDDGDERDADSDS